MRILCEPSTNFLAGTITGDINAMIDCDLSSVTEFSSDNKKEM
jgi:hypothetical protein